MLSAISSATLSVADITSSTTNAQIAALEKQIVAYQKQLQNTQLSAQQTQIINAQVAQLEAQIVQLEAQQIQQALQAQQEITAASDANASKTSNSNLPNAITEALAHSLSDSNTETTNNTAVSGINLSSDQTPQAALHTFMQNLFTALGQESSTTSAKGGSNLSGNLQSLIRQLNSNVQFDATDAQGTLPLQNLNSSFQNLVGLLNAAQAHNATGTTTLHAFLQNLAQDLSNGQNISGAILDTEV
jgi:FlxA-like protein